MLQHLLKYKGGGNTDIWHPNARVSTTSNEVHNALKTQENVAPNINLISFKPSFTLSLKYNSQLSIFNKKKHC